MAPKVLLVDDDPLMHRLYSPHLQRAGYQMFSAFTGVEAIDLAARELPQVIVMDIMMPEMDGLSAIRLIRSDEATKNIPVVVITANPQYHMCQQESEWAGATVFLTKPFGPASLVAAIRGLIPPESGGAGEPGKD
jgi:CheY-like chemotaxis protein